MSLFNFINAIYQGINSYNLNNNNNQNSNDKEVDKNKNNEDNEDNDKHYNDNNNININLEKEEDKNKIIWPENEDEEDKQFELAIKQSEEEAKKILEEEQEEERQIERAIKESERENKINNFNFFENNNNFININEIEPTEKKEEEFDEEYGICPITQEYMKNPVLSPSGNYYEKAAIIDWINKEGTEPLTREKLTVDMLIEDEEYKKQIIEYRKKFNK